jgi:hypothetical protein
MMGFLIFVVAGYWVIWLCSDERGQAKFDKLSDEEKEIEIYFTDSRYP